ncbi:NUDIX domain-containing protein [Vibrio sp. 070316B]|uniref:NUDIX domain-containing protein n=1 Tax=unclassified Vibrio TaxID=2614977 RepID=UPI0014938716|nr:MULTISPECIES: NUDIX domain-containing protein [unclassified Vibrio]CAH7106643.1 DNA mismatch repair protein MutT [Vibrio chagasii]NOI41309.1 NUDIX domain-containing protein [Vibrio sp. 070316B]NOI84860.1 NUDIX domain-containing protein [Vibrio sp. 99K-1]CAH7136033.1 DNA mismatch repair protein MutT [Vibrio chagasii]CAH7238622.1 DNA mismatch repair protein MutT [Vibrio chagasii]
MKNVVQIIFVSGSKFLLGFRQNTDAFDQYWGFPSGRIEQGELPRTAAEREAREEVAVDVGNLTLFAIVSDPELPICHYFYLCHEWAGDIQNAEPHLCQELRWFDRDELPENCTPITYLINQQLNDTALTKNIKPEINHPKLCA